ncbi:pitrilysin family protein [Conexibacter stalactiti]|uniref:Pitrilysin family protein n=1 Tax=Conexibacter stalactiti TaxID=1940611 RepID=A0ABU4HQ55_9ACTN|nr:pitrilysin family protein [Conexibacter stalactiti]MDW5595380.1 pitrilysin family protein [Conexibacter stalactiti]MEC5036022.1 pitrilysin family protein [Conexibacter stalactiti]
MTEGMPSVRSVSLGYWIGTGSRGEDDAQAGLSHLIEHLLFKGTARYESLEIDQIFDGMGAELNAGTGKETTSVYSRVIDEHFDLAFDVMSDMVFRPRFDDIDSEREVILEEIAMYEDDPQDKVFDVLGEAVFGDHPLGRSIIGSSEVVARTPVDGIRAFHDSRYVASNVVIAAAGAVDHEALVELARTRVPNGGRSADAPTPQPAPSVLTPRVLFERKDTEQYHVCLGGPGIPRDDDRRYALRVLDTLFGGTSSSRLFQEVREKRGLAYSVYSFTGQFSDTGQIGLYVGTRSDNLAPALEVVARELERLQREPGTADELLRAKENLKGRVVLSLESTGSRMNRLGSAVLSGMPLLSLDEIVARIDAVSLDDLAEMASELFDPAKLSTGGIGPDEDLFRAALGPLAPQPVGA